MPDAGFIISFNERTKGIVNNGDIYIQCDVPDGANLLNYDGDIIVEGKIQSGAKVSLILTGIDQFSNGNLYVSALVFRSTSMVVLCLNSFYRLAGEPQII